MMASGGGMKLPRSRIHRSKRSTLGLYVNLTSASSTMSLSSMTSAFRAASTSAAHASRPPNTSTTTCRRLPSPARDTFFSSLLISSSSTRSMPLTCRMSPPRCASHARNAYVSARASSFALNTIVPNARSSARIPRTRANSPSLSYTTTRLTDSRAKMTRATTSAAASNRRPASCTTTPITPGARPSIATDARSCHRRPLVLASPPPSRPSRDDDDDNVCPAPLGASLDLDRLATPSNAATTILAAADPPRRARPHRAQRHPTPAPTATTASTNHHPIFIYTFELRQAA
mmetsp:Transcript_7216/g.23885  ORF Transcript_7216/g.23885 Transcript_7216/m.23885 type:complete len:289 (-) Transcript_7216:75-941(-)